jgi:uncharacterized membrane protein YfcA
MTNPIILILFGVLVGIFSGLMGLGGGSIMIPIMVLLFGFTQARAHGMSLLVMIPPVTLPAVIGYWRSGHLRADDLWIAAVIALGVLIGSYFGSQIAVYLAQQKGLLKLVFGFLLVYVAGYTAFSWFGTNHVVRSAVLAAVVLVFAVTLFFAVRAWDASRARADAGDDVANSIAKNG